MSLLNAGLPNQPDKATGKPLRITRILAGAGSWKPLVDGGRCFVTLVAGGGGSGIYSGGSGGNSYQGWQNLFGVQSYAVGAAGAAKGAGGNTALGHLEVIGGQPGSDTAGSVVSSISQTGHGFAPGGFGGAGVADASQAQRGGGAGQQAGNSGTPGAGGSAGTPTAGGSGGGGGSSILGRGGTGGYTSQPGLSGTGYGAGAGGGPSGSPGTGGIIIIEEYGL